MSKASNAHALLIVALQDLLAAERAWMERGPAIGAEGGEDFRALIESDIAATSHPRAQLTLLLGSLDAPCEGDPNIWMNAILDDAERDIRSTVPGPARDTALVGAIRKGKQAARVSYETAIALAKALHREDDAEHLCECRDRSAKADRQLAKLLRPLTVAAAD